MVINIKYFVYLYISLWKGMLLLLLLFSLFFYHHWSLFFRLNYFYFLAFLFFFICSALTKLLGLDWESVRSVCVCVCLLFVVTSSCVIIANLNKFATLTVFIEGQVFFYFIFLFINKGHKILSIKAITSWHHCQVKLYKKPLTGYLIRPILLCIRGFMLWFMWFLALFMLVFFQ